MDRFWGAMGRLRPQRVIHWSLPGTTGRYPNQLASIAARNRPLAAITSRPSGAHGSDSGGIRALGQAQVLKTELQVLRIDLQVLQVLRTDLQVLKPERQVLRIDLQVLKTELQLPEPICK